MRLGRDCPIPALIGLAGLPGLALATDLPTHAELRQALRALVAEDNVGFGFQMWATLVDRDGTVKAVAYSGDERDDQWPGSRVISAQKASTANAFSLPRLALSTANLYSAVQPGGSLHGLQFSNPVATDVAYRGPAERFGSVQDPRAGRRLGGVNVFGGGVALYDNGGTLLGGLGVSGDSACADHNIAWKLRHRLDLDNVPAGVSLTKDDNIVYDIADTGSAGGWGHPACSAAATRIALSLVDTHPLGPRR